MKSASVPKRFVSSSEFTPRSWEQYRNSECHTASKTECHDIVKGGRFNQVVFFDLLCKLGVAGSVPATSTILKCNRGSIPKYGWRNVLPAENHCSKFSRKTSAK